MKFKAPASVRWCRFCLREFTVYLTSSSLASWLTQRGLIDPASITAGQFAIQEVEHHNRGFRVYRPADNPLYVKQLREFDRPNILCLEREAAFGAAAGYVRPGVRVVSDITLTPFWRRLNAGGASCSGRAANATRSTPHRTSCSASSSRRPESSRS